MARAVECEALAWCVKSVTAPVSRRSSIDCGRDNTEVSCKGRGFGSSADLVSFTSLLGAVNSMLIHGEL